MVTKKARFYCLFHHKEHRCEWRVCVKEGIVDGKYPLDSLDNRTPLNGYVCSEARNQLKSNHEVLLVSVLGTDSPNHGSGVFCFFVFLLRGCSASIRCRSAPVMTIPLRKNACFRRLNRARPHNTTEQTAMTRRNPRMMNLNVILNPNSRSADASQIDDWALRDLTAI